MQARAVDNYFISRTLAMVYCLENHFKKEFGFIHIDFLYVWDFLMSSLTFKGCTSLHVLTPDMRNCDSCTHATFRPELLNHHKCLNVYSI